MKPYELTYRHYTSNKNKKNLIKDCILGKDDYIAPPIYKPSGLWGSPVPDVKNTYDFYTWKMWLENQGYKEDDPTVFGSKYYFDFKIKDSAKILTIMKVNDIEKYKKYVNDYNGKLDDSIYDKYDGVFLYHGKDYFNIHFDRVFNSWDVDSIVVWNPDIIIEV